jgi:hypothetical protein
MATTAHIMAMATTDPTTATDGPIMVMDMAVAGVTETRPATPDSSRVESIRCRNPAGSPRRGTRRARHELEATVQLLSNQTTAHATAQEIAATAQRFTVVARELASANSALSKALIL